MAIVRKPKGFLFDEPLANLDAPPRVNMRIELSRLHKELGTTMIYVTHDPLEAMTMGDRIAVFNKGHIKQLGAPRVDGAQHLLSSKVAAGQTPIDTGHVVGLCPDARWALRFDANARRVA